MDLGLVGSLEDENVVPITRWIASLSDGRTIFMDNKAGMEPEHTWQRLKIECENKGLFITALRLQNRSHVVNIPGPMDGYYFSFAFFGGTDGTAKHQWAVGYQIDYDTVHVDYYFVPELEIQRSIKRSISDFNETDYVKFIQKPND